MNLFTLLALCCRPIGFFIFIWFFIVNFGVKDAF